MRDYDINDVLHEVFINAWEKVPNFGIETVSDLDKLGLSYTPITDVMNDDEIALGEELIEAGWMPVRLNEIIKGYNVVLVPLNEIFAAIKVKMNKIINEDRLLAHVDIVEVEDADYCIEEFLEYGESIDKIRRLVK
jgi:hypothetical protein